MVITVIELALVYCCFAAEIQAINYLLENLEFSAFNKL